MSLSKGLMSRLATAIARVKRTGNKVKTGAAVSRPVVTTTPRVADLHVAPAGHFGGVWFREVTNLTDAGLRVAMAARAQSVTPVIVPVAPPKSKYVKVHPSGPGKTGRANSVPSLDVRVVPVAKKEVVKEVKKSVPAVMVRKQVAQAAKAAAVIVAVREIVAMKDAAKAALSTAKGQSLKAAKAVLTEIKDLLGMALQAARAISHEVAV